MNAVGECDLCATHPRRIPDNLACSAPSACPAGDQEAIFRRLGAGLTRSSPRTRPVSGNGRMTGTAACIQRGYHATQRKCLFEQGRLFVPARRCVAARRDRASPPFRESRQPVILLCYLEQATLILHRIRGQSPCPFRALAPVIRVGQKICH